MWIAALFLLFSGAQLHSGDEQLGSASSSNSDSSAESPGRPIRTDVQLVLVSASVIDSYDRFVTGLRKENFQVYEDKEPQRIAHFSSEEVPISVGIVFDASGSMSTKMDMARLAVWQFLRTANPLDEFFLIEFNDRPVRLTDFTADARLIQDKLNFTAAQGRTALLDAVYLGLHEMRKAQHSRKVLLVFSDGGDNNSRYQSRDIKRAVRESDVQIYAVGIYEPSRSLGHTMEELLGPSLLNEIAQMTGGRELPVENRKDLPAVARRVAREVRHLYVLGYSPSNKRSDGKWRKIQVKLRLPNGLSFLRLFSKSGYYAPRQW